MSMDAQALPPPKEVGGWGFLVATIVLGIAGSFAGLAAFAQGTYAVGPFVVDLAAKPASSGTTNLSIAPRVTGLQPGFAEAKTHSGFLSIDARVVDLARPPRIDLAAPRAASPMLLTESLKEDSKAAGRAFAKRAALGVVGGGAAGGLMVALFGFRPRRVFQGALAGTLVVGILAVIAWQTYDTRAFTGTQFKPEPVAAIRAP